MDPESILYQVRHRAQDDKLKPKSLKSIFTGIIQTTGEIKKLTGSQIIIAISQEIVSDLKKGCSISVDGACLTVVSFTGNSFTADFMPETAKKTIIGSYKERQLVNLELAMPANGRFDGHIVSGHVECIGEVCSMESDGNAYILQVQLPDITLMNYVIPKGSITINGISLTVVTMQRDKFSVSIIPHTWEITNLHNLKVGDKVNVETDILAKYAEKRMK